MPAKTLMSSPMTRLSQTSRLSSSTGTLVAPRASMLTKSSTTRLADAAVRVASRSMSARSDVAM